jgi:hypothetical protein
MSDEPDDLAAGFAAIVADLVRRGVDPHAEDKAFWAEMKRQRRVWEKRPRGRPRGYTYSREQLLLAYRKLRIELDRRPKQSELGLRLTAKPRQIRAWLTGYGLPWPPE